MQVASITHGVIINGYNLHWFTLQNAFALLWMLLSQNSHTFSLFFWITWIMKTFQLSTYLRFMFKKKF